MPKEIEDLNKLHQNQLREEMPEITLYEIETPEDPPRALRVTNYTEPVIYGRSSLGKPIDFRPVPLFHTGLENTKEGDLPTIQLQVGNASHGGELPGDRVGDMIDAFDGMEGQRVLIRVLNIQCIDEPTSTLKISTQIAKASVTNSRVTLELAPFNIFDAPFPPDRYRKKSCGYRFGNDLCGYAIVAGATNEIGGGYDVCERTLPACRIRGLDEVARNLVKNHPLNFGGKKGIPGRVTS